MTCALGTVIGPAEAVAGPRHGPDHALWLLGEPEIDIFEVQNTTW